jgi:hypothetical protein
MNPHGGEPCLVSVRDLASRKTDGTNTSFTLLLTALGLGRASHQSFVDPAVLTRESQRDAKQNAGCSPVSLRARLADARPGHVLAITDGDVDPNTCVCVKSRLRSQSPRGGCVGQLDRIGLGSTGDLKMLTSMGRLNWRQDVRVVALAGNAAIRLHVARSTSSCSIDSLAKPRVCV